MEDAFDEASVCDIPIGASLNDVLLGVNEGRWVSSHIALALAVKHLSCRPKANTSELWPSSHSIIAVSMAPRYHGLLLPVVGELRRMGQTVITLTKERGLLENPQLGETATEAELGLADNPDVLRAILSQLPRWVRILSSAVRRGLIPAAALAHLLDSIIFQSLRTQRFVEFLKFARPLAVVTDYDRSFFGSAVALAARYLRIPVFTLVHGAMGDKPGFTPLVADVALCWGKRQANALQQLGVDLSRLAIVGCPQFATTLPNKAHTRRLLGLDNSKGVVVFASSGGRHDDAAQQLVSLFCGALPSDESVVGLVRLHPGESVDDFGFVRRTYPNVLLHSSADATLQQTLAAADLVVTNASTVGEDAVANGVPAAIFDPSTPGIQPAGLFGLGQHGLHAASQQELASLIEAFMSNSHTRMKWTALAAAESETYCRYRGEQAARTAAIVILNRTGESLRPA